MITVAVQELDEADEAYAPQKQVDRYNRSLQIVIWMYDNYPNGVLALRRWKENNALKTNGVTREAFEAARRHFNNLGDTELLDLANIARVVEERVDLQTEQLDRTPYSA